MNMLMAVNVVIALISIHIVPLISLLILSINMMITIIIIYCHYHAAHLTCTVTLYPHGR